MPGLSKVIVLDADVRASRQVQLGFERESVPAVVLPADAAMLEQTGDDAGLVVIGGADGAALELVRRARKWLDDQRVDAPILFASRGVRRTDAEAAGADEVVVQPTFLRDIVTVGRLLRGLRPEQRTHLVGSLVDVAGVLPLIRALAGLGRSATLTLIRGLRRGEVRFYHGEVTSAQVGLIHGQAALHQLLLWTDARFDFHHEEVVRRQQIPLSHDELFADAERFLESVRDASGGLSPAIVLEQDVERLQALGKQIPTEVYGVLRMFDGYRVLADVLEDSAYRVFETLRVAQRAVEVGLLRVVDKEPPRPAWRAILGIEEWLVGSESHDSAPDPEPVAMQTTLRGSAPAAGTDSRRAGRKPRRKKKRRVSAQQPVAHAAAPAIAPIDWGALVPRVVGAEVGPLAGVVPAAQASGEIVEAPQGARSRALGPDMQPTIVLDEEADTRETPKLRPVVSPEELGLAADEPTAADALPLLDQPPLADVDPAAALGFDETTSVDGAVHEQREAERLTAESAAQAEADARAKAEAAARARAEASGKVERATHAETTARMRRDAERLAARTATQAEADARALAEVASRASADAHDTADAAAQADAAVRERLSASHAAAEAATRADADARDLAAAAAQAAIDARAMAEAAAQAEANARASAAIAAEAETVARERREAERLAAEAAADAEAEARTVADAAVRAEADARTSAEAARSAAAAAREQREAQRLAAEAAAEAEAEAQVMADAAVRADADARVSEGIAAHAEVSARMTADAAARAEAARAEAEAQADAAKAEAAERAEPARAETEARDQRETDRLVAVAIRAEADARAASALADAIRAVGNSMSLGESGGVGEAPGVAQVVDDMALDDTKPERVLPRPRPTSAGGLPIAESHDENTVVEEITAKEDSGATTARLSAVSPPSPVVHDVVPGEYRSSPTDVLVAAAPEAAAGAALIDDPDDEDDEPVTSPGFRIPRTTVRGVAAPRIDDGAPGLAEPRAIEQGIGVHSIAEPRTTERGVVASRPTERGFAAAAPAAEPGGEASDAAAFDANTPVDLGARDSTPSNILDEPSDGIIRQHITTADTAPVKRRRLPSDPPDDDRPGAATGEITTRARAMIEPRHSEPSILVADLISDLPAPGPPVTGPVTAPVTDVVSDRVTAPVATEPAPPRPRDKRSSEPRRDAIAFSDLEEAFFKAGHEKEAAVAAPPTESFDDLDEGYRPVGFWDRLRGRSPRRRRKPTPAVKPDKTGKSDKPHK
jgi:hypothetical protein